MADITKMYQIEFDGNRIDEIPGVNLHYYNFTDLPQREMSVHKIARRNLSVLTSAEYSQKQITLYAEICSGTRQDAERTLSRLKAVLQTPNSSLRVLQAHRAVEYTATLQEVATEWNGYHAYVEITFLATNPIGRSIDAINLFTMTGITNQARSVTFNVDGSFNAEPLITIVLNSVSGTQKSITLLNARTSQGLTLTEDFQSGDIISVDCENYTVERNGINIDYSGLFPQLPPGQQAFSYSDTFDDRLVDISATYKPRYT